MRVLRSRNVNGLFYEGMHLLDEVGEHSDSRAGPVVVAPWPVVSVYEKPQERVLFDTKRDANPFFHLMEGLWMLAGRNDAAFLNRYVSDFGTRFAESASGRSGAEASGVIHDAYGHRWRSALGHDQLDEIVRRLRADPADRQCVLQMWDARQPRCPAGECDAPGTGSDDLLGGWRTRPCNTHAYFRVRESREIRGGELCVDHVLDMTICCRSNDAIWGAHGANAVHFSMMMEYVAGRVGCGVGTLFQLSNNYHAYFDALEKIGDPTLLGGHDPYDDAEVHATSMATNWSAWDDDLRMFMAWHDNIDVHRSDALDILHARAPENAWFYTVAGCVAVARWQWTNGFKPSAVKTAQQIAAPDWRRACVEWMERRKR